MTRLASPVGLVLVLVAHQAGQLVGRATQSWWVLWLGYVLAAGLAAKRLTTAAAWALVALGAAQCWLLFPRTANHAYLGVILSLMLALEAEALVGFLTAIVFFWSGVQKLAHGYWFDGQMLGWLVVTRPDVAATVRPFLDEATLSRLAEVRVDVEQSGPLSLAWPWRLVSNAVWLIALLAPVAWPMPKVRRHAGGVVLVVVWGIQCIAHEFEFGLLLTLCALVSAPPKARQVGLLAVLAGVGSLALARLGVLPVLPAFREAVGQ